MARQTIQNSNASLTSITSSYTALTQTAGLPAYNNTAYSVFARFKSSLRPSVDNVIWSEGNSGTNTPLFLIDCGASGVGGLRVRMVNDAGTVLIPSRVTTTKLNPNQWYDILWVDVAGVCKLYINGVADATDFNYSPSGAFTLNRSTIGALGRTTYSNGMIGMLSDIQLYNYGITATQVSAVRNGQLKGNVGNYPLSEGAGSIAYDTSGNGNNGTITSGTWTRDTPTKTRKLVNNNLVYNGDFEIAPQVNVPTTTQFRWIDGTASGNNVPTNIFGWGIEALTGTGGAMFDNGAMKLSTTATGSRVDVTPKANSAFINTLIPVLPGTSYTATGRIKTSITSGSATVGALLRAIELAGDQSSSVINNTLATGIVATQDWTTYTLTFTTAATTRFIKMFLQFRGNDGAATLIGDAFFDDIQLYPTTPVTRNVATGRSIATGRSAA